MGTCRNTALLLCNGALPLTVCPTLAQTQSAGPDDNALNFGTAMLEHEAQVLECAAAFQAPL